MPAPFITPRELHQKYPASIEQQAFIADMRQEIRGILNGKDSRLLLIVGPCSIHDLEGAEEYAKKLKSLKNQVADSFLVIMRTYFEKPRTALGWKGLIHDPLLDGSHQMELGLSLSREFLLKLAELKIGAACEFLDPAAAIYNGDLISWGCIGARTSSSQVHRQIASDLAMPIAFKNSTDGSVENAVNGCLAATYPHAYLGLSESGALKIHHSKGNPDAHIVLRGGESKPNYDPQSVRQALQALHRAGLSQRLLIDCSHDNSSKKYELQPKVFEEALEQALRETPIAGIMLESYLQGGSQPLRGPLEQLRFGISVTDPCLSWEETESLVLQGAAKIQARLHAGANQAGQILAGQILAGQILAGQILA
jgi:3-deoxy-7-phosphoheptulonate synthase